jgi:hypothetical protein
VSTTNDPNDPRLASVGPDGMQETYLVLSEEERAPWFVRPVRRSYRHVGLPGPAYLLRDLTDDEAARYFGLGYVKYEEYPANELIAGRYWTQAQLDAVGKGCGAVTTMGQEIAETYAVNPGFYAGTYCAGCSTHKPVGRDGEFVWDGTNERVGT